MAGPAVAAVVVSHGHDEDLPALVSSLGDDVAEVVVVENGPRPEATRAALAGTAARVLVVDNEGFGAANNHGARETSAPWLLFLNPDAEIVSGSVASLAARLDARPRVALAGVRQIDATGAVVASAYRFPAAWRAWAEAFGGDRVGLAERVPAGPAYDDERQRDWVAGSFLLARRRAFDEVGGFDGGFFLYSEETDLCRRLNDAGWSVLYSPAVTVRHRLGAGAESAFVMREMTRSRRRYAHKHLRPPARTAYLAAWGARMALRAAAGPRGTRAAARGALAELVRGGRPWTG